MPDIDDIWSDDEFAEYENSKLDWRERSMRQMAMNQARREREKKEPRNDG